MGRERERERVRLKDTPKHNTDKADLVNKYKRHILELHH